MWVFSRLINTGLDGKQKVLPYVHVVPKLLPLESAGTSKAAARWTSLKVQLAQAPWAIFLHSGDISGFLFTVGPFGLKMVWILVPPTLEPNTVRSPGSDHFHLIFHLSITVETPSLPIINRNVMSNFQNELPPLIFSKGWQTSLSLKDWRPALSPISFVSMSFLL